MHWRLPVSAGFVTRWPASFTRPRAPTDATSSNWFSGLGFRSVMRVSVRANHVCSTLSTMCVHPIVFGIRGAVATQIRPRQKSRIEGLDDLELNTEALESALQSGPPHGRSGQVENVDVHAHSPFACADEVTACRRPPPLGFPLVSER